MLVQRTAVRAQLYSCAKLVALPYLLGTTVDLLFEYQYMYSYSNTYCSRVPVIAVNTYSRSTCVNSTDRRRLIIIAPATLRARGTRPHLVAPSTALAAVAALRGCEARQPASQQSPEAPYRLLPPGLSSAVAEPAWAVGQGSPPDGLGLVSMWPQGQILSVMARRNVHAALALALL